jgi:redox-sensitive bicupin YhaK (pirin superfamily)
VNRRLIGKLQAPRVIDDGDMLLRRALPSSQRESLGPFVFIDHYRHQSRRGIGDRPHPHAGIEVISYLLEGGMEHRDSMGFRDRLGPGDAQWICSGRGILHAEQPTGGRHGLQLWTSLPTAQKLAEPQYRSFRADEIPTLDRAGVRIKLVAGRVDDKVGPMALATPTVLAHVQLSAQAEASVTVDSEAELGIYVLNGGIELENDSLETGMLGFLSPGSRVRIKGLPDVVDVVLLGGTPAEGPILFGGSFVMDTEERLRHAQRNFADGKMGRLEGVPF